MRSGVRSVTAVARRWRVPQTSSSSGTTRARLRATFMRDKRHHTARACALFRRRRARLRCERACAMRLRARRVAAACRVAALCRASARASVLPCAFMRYAPASPMLLAMPRQRCRLRAAAACVFSLRRLDTPATPFIRPFILFCLCLYFLPTSPFSILPFFL